MIDSIGPCCSPPLFFVRNKLARIGEHWYSMRNGVARRDRRCISHASAPSLSSRKKFSTSFCTSLDRAHKKKTKQVEQLNAKWSMHALQEARSVVSKRDGDRRRRGHQQAKNFDIAVEIKWPINLFHSLERAAWSTPKLRVGTLRPAVDGLRRIPLDRRNRCLYSVNRYCDVPFGKKRFCPALVLDRNQPVSGYGRARARANERDIRL